MNGNFSNSLLTQMNMHQKSDFKDLFLNIHVFNSHLDLQMSVLCSVEFVDIYKALYCHTQTGCSVVIDATSRKHMTVFSFGYLNRFRVVAVNGGQWIESYLTISSCKTNVFILLGRAFYAVQFKYVLQASRSLFCFLIQQQSGFQLSSESNQKITLALVWFNYSLRLAE